MQRLAILNELRRMSARVGENILLTQAAGGDSSTKQGDVLWVKASGAWPRRCRDQGHLPSDLALRSSRVSPMPLAHSLAEAREKPPGTQPPTAGLPLRRRRRRTFYAART